MISSSVDLVSSCSSIQVLATKYSAASAGPSIGTFSLFSSWEKHFRNHETLGEIHVSKKLPGQLLLLNR